MHAKKSAKRFVGLALAALVSIPLSLSGLWVGGASATDLGHDSAVDFALELDGTGSQAAVRNLPVLPTTEDFVLEAWVFDRADGATGGTRRIVSQGNSTSHDGGFDLMTLQTASPKMREVALFYKCPGACDNALTSTGVFIQNNSWQHLALVTSGSSFDLYVNGVFAASRTVSTGSMPTSARFVLGRPWLSAVNGSFFNGQIDEVNVWTKPGTVSTRSGFETWIQGHMHTFTPSNADGLVARFDFNEGSGATVFDRTVGNNDLALSGTPAFSDVKTESQISSETILTFPRSYLTSGGGWTVPSGVTDVKLLVVGGGGGGGSRHGGGGGAGALIYDAAANVSGTLKVQVGQGGNGGSSGQSSFFGNLELKGGGRGAGSAGSAQTGGSSGGRGSNTAAPASATGTGNFNGGGNGAGTTDGNYAGGGGGGAISVGSNAATNAAGSGGAGFVSNITGASVCYAAGGGGGSETTGTAGSAGTCTSGQVSASVTSSAGAGSVGSATASSASPNSGSGGGGGGHQTVGNTSGAAGFGGAGIVVASYGPVANPPLVTTDSSTLVGQTVELEGNVSSENGSSVTERGFVYATSTGPTTSSTKLTVGSGAGSFSGVTPTLTAGTYYFRAFATSANGTSYGSEFSEIVPSVVAPSTPGTPTATAGNSSASLTWTPSGSGTPPITYSVETIPSDGTCVVAGAGSGTTASCTGLTNGVSYQFRVIASNGPSSTSTSSTSSSVTPTAPPQPVAVPPVTEPPASPNSSHVRLSGDGQTLRVATTPQAPANVTKYIIKLEPSGKSCEILSSTSHCEIAKVKSGVEYKVLVVAANSLGQSEPRTLGKRVLLGPSGWLERSGNESFENFTGYSAQVRKAIKTNVNKFVRSHTSATFFTCTGFAVGTLASERILDLATARAKVICDRLVARNSRATYDLKARAKIGEMIGSNRKVVVRAYSPLTK